MEKSFIVYDHISPSGKHYIGQTNQKPTMRWRKGAGYKDSSAFYPAILKYGWDNFEHKVLFTGLTKLEADMIEEDLIHYYKKLGLSYNVAVGGSSGMLGKKHTNEAKQKISNAGKGRVRSAEVRQKISEANQGNNHRSKKVKQYTLDGLLVKEWSSTMEIQRVLGFHNSAISRSCNNSKTAYGYKWEYYG